MGEDKVTVKVNDMSLLSIDDQILDDTLILPKIKEFLGHYLALDISYNSGILSESIYGYKIQHTNYINTAVQFTGVTGQNNWSYSIESIVKCSSLSLEFINNEYVIKPSYVKWPIIIKSCGEARLPSYIKFYKNPRSKTPLTFIVKSWTNPLDGYDNWIFDLPKGSIVYLINNNKIWLGLNPNNIDGYDFTKDKDFDGFIEEYGKKIII